MFDRGRCEALGGSFCKFQSQFFLLFSGTTVTATGDARFSVNWQKLGGAGFVIDRGKNFFDLACYRESHRLLCLIGMTNIVTSFAIIETLSDYWELSVSSKLSRDGLQENYGYQLNDIGHKAPTGGWFVLEGESVLLAHDDGSCSFDDVANCEQKDESIGNDANVKKTGGGRLLFGRIQRRCPLNSRHIGIHFTISSNGCLLWLCFRFSCFVFDGGATALMWASIHNDDLRVNLTSVASALSECQSMIGRVVQLQSLLDCALRSTACVADPYHENLTSCGEKNTLLKKLSKLKDLQITQLVFSNSDLENVLELCTGVMDFNLSRIIVYCVGVLFKELHR